MMLESGEYRCERLSRRTLIALPLAALASPLFAAAGKPAPIRIIAINSAELRVADVDRSVAFYQRVFGLPVRGKRGDNVLLGIGAGPEYLAIGPAGSGPTGIASFGFAVEGFDPVRLVRQLSALGVADARVVTPEMVAVTDSRGYQLRLEAPAAAPAPVASEPPGAALPIPVVGFSHVTFMGERSFYQRLFDMPVQAMQGPAYILRAGNGREFITALDFKPPGLPASPMHGHLCLTMEGYDANRVTGLLMEAGLKPVEYTDHLGKVAALTVRTRLRQIDGNGGGVTHPLGSYETYLRDPDNIEIQIQDVSYCGGSGANGQICP